MQRKSMKSKFFSLNIHIGLHFESSPEKSGKFQGGICRQIHSSLTPPEYSDGRQGKRLLCVAKTIPDGSTLARGGALSDGNTSV